MPHLTIEYSSNIPEPVDLAGLFRQLHETLAGMGGFNIEDFKSRAYRVEPFHVGAGGARRAFAHLQVSVLDRNDLDRRRRVAELALGAMREAFARGLAECDCDVTVEVRTMTRECYVKERSGPAAV